MYKAFYKGYCIETIKTDDNKLTFVSFIDGSCFSNYTSAATESESFLKAKDYINKFKQKKQVRCENRLFK